MSHEFKSKTVNPYFSDVEDVSPQEIHEFSANLELIDVRETYEYTGELGHIATAKLVVLSTLPENINSLPKDKAVVFVCKSGGRSAQAAAYAKSRGYGNVYNMAGGMMLWNSLLLPIEK